jgi:tRNA-dihydrouridine synthase B
MLPAPPPSISYNVGALSISPAVVLAPMEGVTDIVFRRVIRAIGGPGLTYTEFIPAKTLRDSKRAVRQAEHDPEERPLAIQIYGRDPQIMADAARVVQEMGASILDINMGCPSKQVCAHSGGSSLLREPEVAVEIVRAVRAAISIPLTVKMRTGFDPSNKNAPELAHRFQEEGADAITIHWRTRQDLYGGVRDVTPIADAVRRLSIPVLGNGDIIDVQSAHAMLIETGCAGVMIGRGAVRDPWLPLTLACWMRGEPLPVVNARERERVLLLYHQKILEYFGFERLAFNRLKMVIKQFAEPLPYGRALRRLVTRAQTLTPALDAIHSYFDLLERHETGDLDALSSSTFATIQAEILLEEGATPPPDEVITSCS